MEAWKVRGVPLPFGDRIVEWWIDGGGAAADEPVDGAEELPGGWFLSGLVDAHAHPALGIGERGPVALDEAQAAANLVAWAESGVSLVRDTGSPAGLTLRIPPDARHPRMLAAGRFLAPAGRYFASALVEPVGEGDLVSAAMREVGRGASWVKVIGDFPRVPEMTDTAPTYPTELVARLTAAVHEAGARVAVHTLLPDAGRFVTAGVDSIEHGVGLDEAALVEMAARGVGWTPTCCAMTAVVDDPAVPPPVRERARAARDRVRELLPFAAARGVPVLAGTDVVGSLPREVALLAELGLEPAQALAAASDTARRFLGADPAGDVVTYSSDPRSDPAVLRSPVAVVLRGMRIR